MFFGNNYGEAAAIDVFGRRLGLPPAISGHNNYYIWGPQGGGEGLSLKNAAALEAPLVTRVLRAPDGGDVGWPKST